ncbi:MAG: hypothetical protein ACF8K1_05325 [Phycisphaerales bacterium JB047]
MGGEPGPDPEPQNMAHVLDLSSFYQTVNAAVISEFDLGKYMPDEAFSIFSTPGINTDRIPKLINRTAVNADDSTDLDRQTETEENIDLSLDAVLKEWQYVGKDQINRVGPEYAARLGQKIGRAVAEGWSDRLAAILAITAMTNSQTVEFNDESTNMDDYATATEDAFAMLDTNKVPHIGRYCLAKPSFFRKAAQSLYYGSSDFRGPAASEMPSRTNSFMANGVMFISWPSPIFSANTASDTDFESKYRRDFASDNIQALCWSDQTIGVKIAENLSVTQDWVPHKQSYLVAGRMHFGTAALQSDGVYAIVGDANSV